ncbi:DNA cytosine methyltransferase [Aliidiomarina maris]|uniref:Cytosine-specific methyltransferase n=1 Tax=Aliidiomarina maris TaxID=531312 RepID=A0A327X1N6_9GAMM|nr:DNA cytosine methyltransferase [Aliidiomarina maris]RAJ98465.1 DNA (cytosine-5)-methyltransferase 1 [Aliidiomarina maris]RUO24725.1 DNA (cytosine-5-)-methyltransferase [Aliidiomarina maris]
MNQSLVEPKVERTAAIRKCQSERRKRLKTLTIEVDKETHAKIKMLAEMKQTTLQALISNNLKSMVDASSDFPPRPWSVFDSLRDESECKRTHVSLFSGCGGVDLGFRQAGFRTVFSNDIDPDACSTYRANLGEIVNGDIHTITPPKLTEKLDVLTAGFPCQPFSNAGSRKGTKDERGTLYQTALKFIEELKPRAVVFENVRGLLSFKTEEKLLIEEICEHLDSLGYDVVFSLVDASKHNVPQKRLRVFIVGIERNENRGKFSFPAAVERDDLSLKHTILDLEPNALNQSELMQLNPQAISIGSMVPEGGSWKSIPYEKLPERLKKIADNMRKYRWPNFYRRFHRDEIAGTITAAFKPENAGVWHPIEQRVFSVREIARIQSFPDWFGFEGKSIKSKYQQIGNAVPPRLAYELALQINKCLSGEDIQSETDSLTFEQFVNTGKPLRACDRDVVFSPKKI